MNQGPGAIYRKFKIRKKRSIVWKFSKEEFENIVKSSNTICEILEKIGLSKRGSNNSTVKRRIIEDGLDISHIPLGRSCNKGRSFGGYKIPLSDILVENSSYTSTHNIKQKLYNAGLKSLICEECGQTNIWNKKPLSLQLDHKNGIYNDHRLENLRILCPNCHSQTVTFAGKNKKPKLQKVVRVKNKKTIKRQNSCGDKNSQFGTIWITDGFNNKKLLSSEDIPFGWKRGRTI